MLPTHEHAHTHVRTRSRKVTYSSKQVGHSRQSILGGGCPCRLSRGEHVRRAPFLTVLGTHRISRSLPTPRSACQPAPPLPQWLPVPRHPHRPRNQTTHAHVACCVGVTLHRMRVTGILWERLAVGRAVASARSTRCSRARRSRVDDTISGLAAGHSGHAHPHSVHAQRS